MPNDPILHLLGLARKAGRLEIGEEPVGAVCRARQARLVLLASDAAPNTCRRAAHFGEAGNVLWLEVPFTKAELGFALGRGSCAMLALTDAGFAASLTQKLAARAPERYGPAAQQLREKADRVLQRRREQAAAREKPPGGQEGPLGSAPAQAERAAQAGRQARSEGQAPPRKTRGGSAPHPSAPGGRNGSGSCPAVPISPALAAAGCPASSGTIPKK
ncbi:MAG: 50S ribosomal protein L7 [Lawsonibacter sp.]